MAFQVSRRVNEIGLRMALGASRGRYGGAVLREVAVLLLAGCVIWRRGGALSERPHSKNAVRSYALPKPGVLRWRRRFWSGRFRRRWLPARRASRVDPMVAPYATSEPARRCAISRACCAPYADKVPWSRSGERFG